MSDYYPTTKDIDIYLEMAEKNTTGKVSLEEYEGIVLKFLANYGIKVYEDLDF